MTVRALLTAGLLVALAACQQSQGPLLTDPRDILSRTIGATSTIRTANVRVDLSLRTLQPNPAGVPQQPQDQGGSGDAVIDLVNGELSATLGTNDGSGRTSVIVADGAAFTQNTSTGRWTRMPMAGGLGGLGPGAILGIPGAIEPPNLPAILVEALADPTTTIELRGVEDCASGRCYRVAVALTPERVFKVVVAATGMDQMPDFDEQAMAAGGFVPGIGLEILSDTRSLRVVETTLSASMQGSAIALRLQLSHLDEPVAIQAPPPALVDDFGIVQEQILEDVGSEVRESPPP